MTGRRVRGAPASGRTGRRPAGLGRVRPLGRRMATVLALAWAAAVPRPTAAQDTHVLVVIGLGGTETYSDRFVEWARELRDGLVARGSVPAERISVLGERTELAPDLIADRSTKENVTREIGRIASSAGEGDQVLVVLIGHGTARGDEGRFNLPGPDLSAADFAAALAAFPTQKVALVHTGSAAGGFIEPISGANRIVVSATRTVRERNATEFPRYFVEAVTGEGADLDKDGAVSLLEAYLYARAEVARHYEEANELLVEHAVLDDDGDGRASQEASAESGDGRLAATFRLGSASAAAAATPTTDDPALARLYEERRDILGRIEGLRAAKETMGADRYDEELEALLVELALKNREIRDRERGGS